MVNYYIGTMGFSYKDWAGVFYPRGLATRDYLSYYSQIFNAVEIDSTFYGIPKPGSVARWRDSTPDGFKICLKVPKAITHDAGLMNVNDEMTSFINAVQVLSDKLGVILLQFPPSFKNSNANPVSEFLADLPDDFRFAVEFRHPSWYIPWTGKMLARYGVCWAATEFRGVPKEVDLTSDTIFIRLVGKHGRFAAHNREQIDTTQQLDRWWQWIRSKSDAVHSVYVFLNDDFSGFAPATANRLKDILGLPVVKSELPKQMKLF